jgi:hypothetical protein
MDCPDCSLDRRSFLKSTLAGTAAVATGLAAPAKRAAQNEPETLVTTLYRSLRSPLTIEGGQQLVHYTAKDRAVL